MRQRQHRKPRRQRWNCIRGCLWVCIFVRRIGLEKQKVFDPPYCEPTARSTVFSAIPGTAAKHWLFEEPSDDERKRELLRLEQLVDACQRLVDVDLGFLHLYEQ